MKTHISKLLAAATFLVIAGFAQADPVQVTYSPVETQINSNGDTQITNWAIASIATFNTNEYDGYPLPSLAPLAFHIGPGQANPVGNTFAASTTHSITLDLTGYQYIVLSWGGSLLDVGNGTADYLYYVNGTGSWTFYNSHAGASGDGAAALANGGLSGIYGFGRTQVPDSGTTLVLLGVGLIGISLAARRRKSA